MSMIAQLGDDIVNRLLALGYPIRLRSGIALSELQKLTREAGLELPRHLVELYMWRDGMVLPDVGPGSCFFPWWSFHSAAYALELYQVLTEPVVDGEEFWQPNWFPFLSSSDLSSMGICCSSSVTDDGPIVHYGHTAGVRIEYFGLRQMLQTIKLALEQKAIFVGVNGELDHDLDKLFKIASSENPGLQWDDFAWSL